MARKAVSVDRYRLLGTYERLRKLLCESADKARLQRPLSYWVLPTDRRLPIAFLDCTLADLLARPLDELLATPGVGQKKILGFFDLLQRASKASSADSPFGLPDKARRTVATATEPRGFDPTTVSEELWQRWCDTVRRCGFGVHKLGRVAPSLQSLPTVIWHTQLDEYLGRTLGQIRRLRTHGEKRVQAILEVFCTIHEACGTALVPEQLEHELVPAMIPATTRWLVAALDRDKCPTEAELRRSLLAPVLAQLENDLGEHVRHLVEGRLAPAAEAPTVKQQADELGVTRARVYQLLDDCGKAMAVRWPEGRWLLQPLVQRLTTAGDATAAELATNLQRLLYPSEHPQPAER